MNKYSKSALLMLFFKSSIWKFKAFSYLLAKIFSLAIIFPPNTLKIGLILNNVPNNLVVPEHLPPL